MRSRERPGLSRHVGAIREVADGAILASGHHAMVNLATTLDETCCELAASLRCNDHLEFAWSAANNCALRADKAILVTLIVREAVSNAVKYAHPTGIPGRITVACRQVSEGVIAIEVADDGVGLPEDFNPETDGAIGFQVMRALSLRLEATLAFTSTDLGLHMGLRLPLEVEVKAAKARNGPPERRSPGNQQSEGRPLDGSGARRGAVNVLVDTSEHKRVGSSSVRRMEGQVVLNQFTDRLFRAESLGDVFDAALDAIGRALGCQRASILLFDDAGIMKFAAWRGLSDGYRQAVEGHSPWARDTRDPQHICIEDIESADIPEPLKAIVKTEGIGALAFIPLVAKGQLVGKFMAYYDVRHVFNDSEIDLAVAIARQLGLSVERMRAEDAHRRAEEELSDFIENAPVALHRLGPDGVILKANRRELDMLGYDLDDYVGRHISEIHVSREAAADILKRVSEGEVLHNYEAQLRCKDGSVRDVLIASSVLWDKGRFVHARCITRDITEFKKADRAAHLLASIIETSGDAIVSKDLNGIVTSWNRGAERVFGYTAEEMVGAPITILIPPERGEEELGILERIRRGERVDHYETIRRRKDGCLIDISLAVSPVKDVTGRVIGASKIARDVTERKRLFARQELLTHEIQHRTKNLFAVVLAVVARSFAGKHTVKDAESAVLSRLHSLAQTHEMLIDKAWQGADLAEVVRTEMSPYIDRAQIEGPPLLLNAKMAQNFALALHELATNAAKYGALSNSTGRVHISWSVPKSNGSDKFTFRWKERGGPPVSQPTQRGFGTAVLVQVMSEYFEVPPRIDFAAAGLSYELKGSLDAVMTDERNVSLAGGAVESA
jgi:PAS domain S-box-containing protein